jgi:hypothetical protein
MVNPHILFLRGAGCRVRAHESVELLRAALPQAAGDEHAERQAVRDQRDLPPCHAASKPATPAALFVASSCRSAVEGDFAAAMTLRRRGLSAPTTAALRQGKTPRKWQRFAAGQLAVGSSLQQDTL